MMHLSRCFRSQLPYDSAVLQPQRCVATTLVWALPRSLATTRGIISLFSLPAGTKMFQFPAFASTKHVDNCPSDSWVVPFGNHRVKGYLLLTGAYRSLSRPSSPPRAKASAVRPSILSRSTTTLKCRCGSYFQLYFLFSILSLKSRTAICLYVLQSCLCQYVKDLVK